MKRVLIISPYFPPVNAADMQRVRMSLPYFENLGWHAEVVYVDEHYTDMVQDQLLCESVPTDVTLHRVKAFPKKFTAKIGFGSLALRAMWQYRSMVDRILSSKKYDLIYFSTTQFPVCALGPHWKKKFGVPYVIDMQDPWHSDYYRDKPRHERPPKYWFSYRLNKWLEPMAMKEVSGLISVSAAYIETLCRRYPRIGNIPAETIPFTASEQDFGIAEKFRKTFPSRLVAGKINIVYCGRGGADVHRALRPVFGALKKGAQNEHDLFGRLHLSFFGTSYATGEQAICTISPLAAAYGVEKQVYELPQRIGFYESLALLRRADALLIPGSDDAQYTASKIFPFILSQKPILAIFHPQSSAAHILQSCTSAQVITFDQGAEELENASYTFLRDAARQQLLSLTLNKTLFAPYTAQNMVKKQVDLFNRIV